MAGLRGKAAWVAMGKQTAKGTPATMAKHMYPVTDGTVEPDRVLQTLQETDDRRDQGVTYVSKEGVKGNPSVYVRDNSIDLLLGAVLGNVVDSGAMPNFIHTITSGATLPYMTAWRMIGDTLWEQFNDVKVSELVIRADAGSPLTAQATLIGLTPLRLASDPSAAWTGPPVVTLESGTVYTYNDATVTLAGGATSLVSSFELSISNGVSDQQTDDVTPYDLNDGELAITLGFDMIFENLQQYNLFHYGSTAGTVASPTLATVAADFLFTKGVNNTIQFTLPGIAYEEFPVEPQADGSPVVVPVRARAQRQAVGTSMLTAVVKNQKATSF